MIAPYYEGAIRTILGVNSTEDYVYRRVSSKQADFMRELISIVETDMASGDCAAYHVLPDGEYRLSRKYAAEDRITLPNRKNAAIKNPKINYGEGRVNVSVRMYI